MDRNNIIGLLPFGIKLCFIQDWNIKWSSFQIDFPHSFNMRILNMSWPWALLGSSFWINIAVSSLVNVTVEIDLSVFFFQNIGGKFTGVIYDRTLFSKKAVKQFCLLFKISYLFILMKERGYARKFCCCLTTISILTSRLLH